MRDRQKIRQGLILFSFFLFPAVFYYLSPVVIIQGLKDFMKKNDLQFELPAELAS